MPTAAVCIIVKTAGKWIPCRVELKVVRAKENGSALRIRNNR